MAWLEHGIQQLQSRLQAKASTKTKTQLESYLKGAVVCRGLKIPQTQAVVLAFLKDWNHGTSALKPVAYGLLQQDYAEDKLAGMMLIQSKLIPHGHILWQTELPVYAALFHDNHIHDWATCDGFCSRVLKPLVLNLEPPTERQACAHMIMQWGNAECMWQKRAAMIPFVTMAAKGDAAMYPGFMADLVATLEHNVQCQERFVQTGTGWLARQAGKADEALLLSFCRKNLGHFTREGLQYATEKLAPATRSQLLEQHKGVKKGAGVKVNVSTRKKDGGIAMPSVHGKGAGSAAKNDGGGVGSESTKKAGGAARGKKAGGTARGKKAGGIENVVESDW